MTLDELPHDKTNKMACAPSEDSDQPGHLPSLIRLGGCPGRSESSLGTHAMLFCWFCHEAAQMFIFAGKMWARMTDTFREICWGIIQGFRDAVLGTLHVFKLDADRKTEVKQQDVPLTTLAKRRAEKQKKGQKEKEKAKERYLSWVMRLWLFSSSVIHSSNAHAQPSDGARWLILVGTSSTSILNVSEQRRLWRDCTDAQACLSLCWLPVW